MFSRGSGSGSGGDRRKSRDDRRSSHSSSTSGSSSSSGGTPAPVRRQYASSSSQNYSYSGGNNLGPHPTMHGNLTYTRPPVSQAILDAERERGIAARRAFETGIDPRYARAATPQSQSHAPRHSSPLSGSNAGSGSRRSSQAGSRPPSQPTTPRAPSYSPITNAGSPRAPSYSPSPLTPTRESHKRDRQSSGSPSPAPSAKRGLFDKFKK
ncbi:hypothetical protein BDW74DRAFT_175683 [Aspergillus multicolor]|uniref:uncharacterized protein n=1 Tax=Aspergillus multicolor TaxID=41759 RepID=UPI003CCDF565